MSWRVGVALKNQMHDCELFWLFDINFRAMSPVWKVQIEIVSKYYYSEHYSSQHERMTILQWPYNILQQLDI